MLGMATNWLWGIVGLLLIATSTVLLSRQMNAAGTAEQIPFWRGVPTSRTWLVSFLALLGLAWLVLGLAFGSELVARLVVFPAWVVTYELVRRQHNRHVATPAASAEHSA